MTWIQLCIRCSTKTNSDFCYLNSTIEYQIIGAHTCTHRDVCIHTHTHTHKVVVAGGMHNVQRTFFFANNLEVFPYRIPPRPRLTGARYTTIKTREHHMRANYITTRIFVYVL